MALTFHTDGKNQLYVEWEQGPASGAGIGGFKRAWIRQPQNPSDDWAGTGKYVSIAATSGLGQGPVGRSADFPIFSDGLPDDQMLVAFVTAICGLTGCRIP